MSIDLSVLSGDFTPEESGRLAKFLAMKREISNTVAECEDCIKVLNQERIKKSAVDPSEMSDEEFLNFFKKLRHTFIAHYSKYMINNVSD